MNNLHPVPYTSNLLTQGQIYTRLMLKEQFGITDMTIQNGIFQPKGSKSIWLFVTEDTSKTNAQYKNILAGNTLSMQGQLKGKTDNKLINHKTDLNELVVFYRKQKREFEKGGFKFEGTFNYKNHDGQFPTTFTLVRSLESISSEDVQKEIESNGEFDPKTESEGRKRILASIVRRRGQAAFRAKLLEAYKGQCAITGSSIKDILEAAHIIPYNGPETNHVQNGIILRADIHTLFDLFLISVDPKDYKVKTSTQLAGTEYELLNGKAIQLPTLKESQPSFKALLVHFEKLIL